MKVSIRVKDLFRGEHFGGLSPHEWLALTEDQKLKQRLTFIHSRASELADTVYRTDLDMPANILGDAQHIRDTAEKALEAMEGGDVLTATRLTLATDKTIADINRLMAVWEQLKAVRKTKERSQKGGKKPKQSEWARLLADCLAGLGRTFTAAWEHIPEDEHAPLELTEDVGVYRSNEGRTVIAVDLVTESEVGNQSQSNFEKRYYRPAKNRAGH